MISEFVFGILCFGSFSFLFCILFGFVYNFRSKICVSNRRLHGKVALITGATSGIGKATATDLAKRGAKVLLACRNLAKAQSVADEIKIQTGNKNIVIYELDTSQLASVRKCAMEILKNEEHLDILINNAGTGAPSSRKLTTDGLEVIMATNHYGHFLLTNLLLGLLKKSCHCRIINVSSSAHWSCKKLDPEDLNFEKQKYSFFKSYSQSKLCNILFTLELSRKLQGSGVTVNSVHPGVVSTDLFEKMDSNFMKCLKYLFPLISKTPERGAQTIIYLAVSEEVDGITGKYFDNCQISTPSELASHGGFAKKLWLASELDVKLDECEIFY